MLKDHTSDRPARQGSALVNMRYASMLYTTGGKLGRGRQQQATIVFLPFTPEQPTLKAVQLPTTNPLQPPCPRPTCQHRPGIL